MLQVTSDVVRCTAPLPCPPSTSSSVLPQHIWKPDSGAVSGAILSLAAVRGNWLAVVSGSRRLHLLQIDRSCTTGVAIVERYAGEVCASQMSSLSLLVLPMPVEGGVTGSSSGRHPEEEDCGDGEMYVAVGEWSKNRLLLFCLSDLLNGRSESLSAPALTLDLLGETPRSAVVMGSCPPPQLALAHRSDVLRGVLSASPVAPDATTAAAPLLLVGTNGGLVLIWELILRASDPRSTSSSGAGSGLGRWQVRGAPSAEARVSNVAVELVEMDDGVYAHSGCDAIFRRPGRSSNLPSTGVRGGFPQGSSTESKASSSAPPPSPALEVCRVHGGKGLRAVCPVTTTSMPPGSMAWVGRDGRLLFGRLDPELKLRWTTAYIGERCTRGTGEWHVRACMCVSHPVLWGTAMGAWDLFSTSQSGLISVSRVVRPNCCISLSELPFLVRQLVLDLAPPTHTPKGDTPRHACFHAASSCHVVLTSDASGACWLRLVHADSLLQVGASKPFFHAGCEAWDSHRRVDWTCLKSSGYGLPLRTFLSVSPSYSI